MPMASPQSIATIVNKSVNEIWNYDGKDNYDAVEKALRFAQTQLQLRKELRSAVNVLQQRHGNLHSLTRRHKKVKQFLEVVFTEEDSEGKHVALRQLEAYTLIFCALSYRVAQIPAANDLSFEFFITNLQDSIRRQNLIPYLHRLGIISAVCNMKISVESFKILQKYLEAQPAPLSAPTFPASGPVAQHGDKEDEIVSSQQKVPKSGHKANVGQDPHTTTTLELRKHPRDESSAHSEEPLQKHTRLGNEPEFFAPTYEPFSTVARPNISKLVERQNNFGLSELIHEGTTTSIKWKQEVEEGGLDITQCVSVFLPNPSEGKDALVLFQVSKRSGWKILDLLDFGQIPQVN